MLRRFRVPLVALTALPLAGCSDFLSGDKLDSDPNTPVSAQAAQLLIGSQVNSYYILSGHGARVLAMWMQQMAGTDRQYIGYDQYSVTEGLFAEFSSAYTGGGRADLKAIQAEAVRTNNKTLGGIAKVWEALIMSFVADFYGDIPFTEANDPKFPTPKLDKQLDVYAKLQTLLDGAIADLGANQGEVGGLDLSLGGSPAAWARVARTLKARLYMHTAEVNSGAYALALAQAQQGISAPSGDLNTYHSPASGEENIWWQFIARDRDSYMRPGKFLVDLMNARGDPRRAEYFTRNAAGNFNGAAPGEGLDEAIHSNLGPGRLLPDFPQPLVTWAENQSIIAEAAYRGGNTALALTTLNALRASFGLPPVAAAGIALLRAILDEKYIALFQSYEVFNDWKRTCYPNLRPSSQAFGGNIPARFTYPVAERTANSENIPVPGSQPRRNQNDPVNATSIDGSACIGQKS
ncbi:MAG: SusD/RagB family nutrient-binding outer membrane lipoprotein [Gemmatimonadaceae bacterium]